MEFKLKMAEFHGPQGKNQFIWRRMILNGQTLQGIIDERLKPQTELTAGLAKEVMRLQIENGNLKKAIAILEEKNRQLEASMREKDRTLEQLLDIMEKNGFIITKEINTQGKLDVTIIPPKNDGPGPNKGGTPVLN